MADICDRAQARSELELRLTLEQRQRQRAAAGRSDCADCGAAIPEVRRALVPGVSRCVDCQAELELRERVA